MVILERVSSPRAVFVAPHAASPRGEMSLKVGASGTVGFVCDKDRFTGEAGAFVFLPRGLPHTFLGCSQPGARVLLLFVPGGIERMFLATGRTGHESPPEQHGIDVVGPPLAHPRSPPSPPAANQPD